MALNNAQVNLAVDPYVSHFVGTGGTYIFRFPTKKGYSNIRMPFNAFRPSSSGEPALDANNLNLTDIAIRFEPGGRYPPPLPRPLRSTTWHSSRP